MNYLYRVKLNGALLLKEEFCDYLKQLFYNLVINKLLLLKITDTSIIEYKFIIIAIPNQFGGVIERMALAQQGITSDFEGEQAAENLEKLDPTQPQPIEIVLTLEEIIEFTISQLRYFIEYLPGEVNHYFGIPSQEWFKLYPITIYDVLKRVDYGSLEDAPLHLFDTTFNEIREHLLDLYSVFYQERQASIINVKSGETEDADI